MVDHLPELAQLELLDDAYPGPTVVSVWLSARSPVAVAVAVASPLAFTALEPATAWARAMRPHMLVASAWLREADVTNAFVVPWDSAYALATAKALPRLMQHLSPASATAFAAARLSAEFTPALKASESASAVVSAVGDKQMQSRRYSGVVVVEEEVDPVMPSSTLPSAAPWAVEDGGVMEENHDGGLPLLQDGGWRVEVVSESSRAARRSGVPRNVVPAPAVSATPLEELPGGRSRRGSVGGTSLGGDRGEGEDGEEDESVHGEAVE